ncbi:methionyl-tRNA formyltransferase [Polaribacter aestuariivivens]|uniref:Methionyl-tRNA formyltransferase n=1 Tax=Polaribacter aestuariivivens TaxID=2304626 RepID=A0A5S3N8G5_9FLAO|nr:formyltransferase family protein [Polaribacter aestuariivivens]TMM29156.1 methionyl-tRNA formyltransferase [Polaribacter aestuariivivens]
MLIQVLVDNPNSWILPYAKNLVNIIKEKFNYEVRLLLKHEEVIKGDVLCLLSCEKIFKKLNLNKYNLVVHESDLPKGKGWSPLTWQVLEGKNSIPITLFEAVEKVDAGIIYNQDFIELKGHELLSEIKHKQGEKTISLIVNFLKDIKNIKGEKQIGEETFYPKRTSKDSELDINKSIKDQFNLLRVCDNERYPAFFNINGQQYLLKIYKKNE